MDCIFALCAAEISFKKYFRGISISTRFSATAYMSLWIEPRNLQR